jgi:hypothetical protein
VNGARAIAAMAPPQPGNVAAYRAQPVDSLGDLGNLRDISDVVE